MKRLVLILFVSWLSLGAKQEAAYETRDVQGSTSHYNGTVGTTAVSIPSSADKVISEVLINTQTIQAASSNLLVSFDGGTTFMTFKRNTIVGWSGKGGITQLKVKGSAAATEYEFIINFEPY